MTIAILLIIIAILMPVSSNDKGGSGGFGGCLSIFIGILMLLALLTVSIF